MPLKSAREVVAEYSQSGAFDLVESTDAAERLVNGLYQKALLHAAEISNLIETRKSFGTHVPDYDISQAIELAASKLTSK